MGEKAQCAKEHSVSTRLTRWNFCGTRNGLCGISSMCVFYILFAHCGYEDFMKRSQQWTKMKQKTKNDLAEGTAMNAVGG